MEILPKSKNILNELSSINPITLNEIAKEEQYLKKAIHEISLYQKRMIESTDSEHFILECF